MFPKINTRESALSLLLLLLGLSGLARAQAKVEIADIWGTITFRAGEPQQIKCIATQADFKGAFLWTVGGRPLPEVEGKETISPGEFEQTFVLLPLVEYDGKELKCKYVERDDRGGILTEGEETIVLQVTHEKLPQGTVNSGQYLLGERAELEVQFELYPAPKAAEVWWSVADAAAGGSAGEEVVRTGETRGKYSVGEIADLGDHRFASSLTIDMADESEAKKEHTLHLRIHDNEKTIPVVFSLVKELQQQQQQQTPPPPPLAPIDTPESGLVDSAELPGTVRPPFDSTTAKAPEDAKLGVGLFVIIAIVVLILLVCIGYCVYQRCCKKSARNSNPQAASTTEDKKTKYALAATSEEKANPV